MVKPYLVYQERKYHFLSSFIFINFERDLERRRAGLEAEKYEAEALIKSARPAIEASREEEEEKGGLVILHASYGNLSKRSNFRGTVSNVSFSFPPSSSDS